MGRCAKLELEWEAEKGIEEMCADSWRWQKNNPNGYENKITEVKNLHKSKSGDFFIKS